MHRNPHQLIEGDPDRARTPRASRTRSSTSAASTRRRPTSSTPPSPRRTRADTSARASSARTSAAPLVVHRGAGAYICGEETALLDSLEGKRGNPRLKPPFPANQGLYQGPTLINNVETLCNVPHIVVNGAEWFRKFGTERSPGTKVVSVSGQRAAPGQLRGRAGHPGARHRLRPRRRAAGRTAREGVVPGRLVRSGADRGGPRPALRLRAHGGGRVDAGLGRDHRRGRLRADRVGRAAAGRVLPPRVVRQVRAVPRGHELDREDAGAHRPRRGHADGPRRDGGRAGQHHRQLPVRAGRLDGDAGRLDDHALPAGVRGAYRRGGSSQRSGSRTVADLVSTRPGWPFLPPTRRPDAQATGSRSRSTGARCGRPRASGCSTRPSAATSRFPTSVTSPSSERRWARAACAWSRSRGCPKLQTSCSTPVKDGMVVYTQTDRVKDAQNAVVEFLLVNHPLDCPVCDKGGECPLQDISYGWGPGRSRFVEDKRNFPKPIALSPLIAIDRERCILCYRCVRFSQEVAEDDQLDVPRARRPHLRRHVRRPPLRRRRSPGNVIELCPVGALTNTAYRFRARPWDIEGAGSVCTLCPSQCNVELTVRDERVERVLAARQRRRRRRLAVRQGPLGLPVDAPRRSASRSRWCATAATCARRRGSARSTAAAAGLRRRDRRPRARGRRADHQRGGLPAAAHLPRGARLAARRLARRADRSRRAVARRLSHPDLAARPARHRPRLRRAGAGDATPWTRRRSSTCGCARRCAASATRLVVASSAPTALDGGASEVLRFAPGAAEALLRALQKALLESGAPATTAPRHGERRRRGGGAVRGHAEPRRVPRRALARAPGRDRRGRPRRPARRRRAADAGRQRRRGLGRAARLGRARRRGAGGAGRPRAAAGPRRGARARA